MTGSRLGPSTRHMRGIRPQQLCGMAAARPSLWTGAPFLRLSGIKHQWVADDRRSEETALVAPQRHGLFKGHVAAGKRQGFAVLLLWRQSRRVAVSMWAEIDKALAIDFELRVPHERWHRHTRSGEPGKRGAGTKVSSDPIHGLESGLLLRIGKGPRSGALSVHEGDIFIQCGSGDPEQNQEHKDRSGRGHEDELPMHD